jgi:hypothetical protein
MPTYIELQPKLTKLYILYCRNMLLKSIITIYLLIAFAFAMDASTSYAIHLTKKDGLPSNIVYNILQDQRGFIWIASDNGLCRYDGVHYKSYTTNPMSSKAGSYIKEDLKGRIWYANFDGDIFYIENDSMKLFGSKHNINTPFGIIQQSIWTLQNNRLISYDIETGKENTVLPVTPVKALHQTNDLIELIDIEGKEIHFYNNTGKLVKHFFVDHKQIFMSFIYHDEYYFITLHGSDLSIEKEDIQGLKTLHTFKNKGQINGAGINQNVCWIATKSGIIYYDLINSQSTFMLEDETISHTINDNMGNKWITTMNGIYIFPKQYKQIAHPLPSSSCRLLNFENTLYLFDNNGEVHVFDPKQNKLQTVYKEPNKKSIYQLYIRSQTTPFFDFTKTNKNEFFKTFHFNNQQGIVFNPGFKDYVLIDDKYAAIATTGNCELIQNASNNLNNPWDSIVKAFQYINQENEHIHYVSIFYKDIRAKSVAFDEQQKLIYFATNIGVKTLSPNGLGEIRFNGQPLFADNIIHDKNQTLFLQNNGELILKSDQQEPIKLIHLSVLFPILQIKKLNNYLILWNEQHVYQLPLSQLSSNTNINDYKLLNIHINTTEINDVEWLDRLLYFSTPQQLITLPWNSIQTLDEIPPFYINEITTPHRQYVNKNNLLLQPNENDISISFSILSYLQEPIDISYQLNTDVWKKIGPYQRKLEFASLSAGDYLVTFKINNVIQKARVSFTLLAPWYMKPWFLVACLLAGMVGIYIYFKKRMSRQQNENNLLLEKTKLEKDLRQSMLSSIKSQMNPHFLFNALNTIQSYIITEDKINASNYLSKFSKLTRKILDMSDKETITLQEEIDALLLYIELEKMRFQELNYTIEIDKNINTNQLFIPSMIIQPYVENAIKHGLLHKPNDKQLFIHISADFHYLKIKIEDNGIGRAMSKSINNHKNETHRSFASHANMKRVELLNIEKNDIGIEYVDKTNDHGEAIGTIINIKIPIKQHR